MLKHFDRFALLGVVSTSTYDKLEAAFLANIAGDLAINQELEKLGNIPAGGITPSNPGQPFKPMPNGLMMEEYYRLLQQQAQQIKQQGQQASESPKMVSPASAAAGVAPARRTLFRRSPRQARTRQGAPKPTWSATASRSPRT